MISKSFSNGFDRPVAVVLGLALFLSSSSYAGERSTSSIQPLGPQTSSSAHSIARSSYSVRVPVVSAKPIVTSRSESIPERTCAPVRSSSHSNYPNAYGDRYGADRYPRERDSRGNNIGGQILGGLIGGAIGNQFGKGNGRKALTIAGAVVGSSIARDRRHPQRGYSGDYEPEYVCQTSTRERITETVTGYDVTYSYNGALYERRMDYDPGRSLELRVTAEPLPATPINPSPEVTSGSDPSRSSRRIL